LSLTLPQSILEKLIEVAAREGVSMNQLVSSAITEKLAALLSDEYLHERAKRASEEKFEAVLRKIQDAPPLEGDELPEP
jgi:hypothetical protein